MKKHIFFRFLFIALFFIQACATSQYIHDPSSKKRQKELQSCRFDNALGDVLSGINSIFMAALLETDIEFYPGEQQFKKLNLINPTGDTIYVNMLTDIYWDENDYCDFMDIRIPPKTECKVIVPIAANYNLYFSPTPESDDDEMLEIYTSRITRISLKPGMTTLVANEKR